VLKAFVGVFIELSEGMLKYCSEVFLGFGGDFERFIWIDNLFNP